MGTEIKKKQGSNKVSAFFDAIYKAMKSHPYLTLAFLCALFGFSTGCEPSGMNYLMPVTAAVGSLVSAAFLRGYFLSPPTKPENPVSR